MGQKIHPVGFRLPVTRNWASRWYASNQNFAAMLADDLKVRDYLKTRLKSAAVSRILIERPAKNARITIFSARPGVVIGKKGEDIENLKAELTRRLGVPVAVNIEEVRKPEIDAQLIADSITQQLEKRIMLRRAMKRAMALRLPTAPTSRPRPAAPRRRRDRQVSSACARSPRRAKENKHAATRTQKIPQGTEGPQHRHRHPRRERVVRRFRPEGHRAR